MAHPPRAESGGSSVSCQGSQGSLGHPPLGGVARPQACRRCSAKSGQFLSPVARNFLINHFRLPMITCMDHSPESVTACPEENSIPFDHGTAPTRANEPVRILFLIDHLGGLGGGETSLVRMVRTLPPNRIQCH